MKEEASGKKPKMNAKNKIMLIEEYAVRKRWAEHFQRLLNVEEVRESENYAVGREQGLHLLGELNNSGITKDEAKEPVKEMRAGNAAGLYSCAVELLKIGGGIVVGWLIKLFNICFHEQYGIN